MSARVATAPRRSRAVPTAATRTAASRSASPPLADLEVEVRYATRRPWVPARTRLVEWARAAAGRDGRGAELSIRIVGPRESRALNRDWRGRDRATNVLSFDGEPAAAPRRLLGDLAICASVVAREAREQRRPRAAHWAHMVVHGVLHLLGLDHERGPAEARRMERRERTILARLGYADPYGVT